MIKSIGILSLFRCGRRSVANGCDMRYTYVHGRRDASLRPRKYVTHTPHPLTELSSVMQNRFPLVAAPVDIFHSFNYSRSLRFWRLSSARVNTSFREHRKRLYFCIAYAKCQKKCPSLDTGQNCNDLSVFVKYSHLIVLHIVHAAQSTRS